MNIIRLGELILLIFGLTIDSFILSFAYGISKCKLSFKIIVLMNLISSTVLAVSLWSGSRLGNLMPGAIAQKLSLLLLISIGGYKLFTTFRKKEESKMVIKQMSLIEGLLLAFALSLDGSVVGIGAGLLYTDKVLLVLSSFGAGIITMHIGWHLGFQSKK